uniref:Secreted protein n=1 Tax=Ascaris lumbricoides TaxID=6252 RepID=A0A0M3ICK6_ASCLU
MLLLALIFSLAYIITDYRLQSSAMQNQQTFASYQIHYRDPRDDFFAMRALPDLPPKYRNLLLSIVCISVNSVVPFSYCFIECV